MALAAFFVSSIWMVDFQISTITSIEVLPGQVDPADTCTLEYGRDSSTLVKNSTVGILKGASLIFAVSPKVRITDLSIRCETENPKFDIKKLTLRFFGIISLAEWHDFSQNLFARSFNNKIFALKSNFSWPEVYAQFPQNYVLKVLLSILVIYLAFLILRPTNQTNASFNHDSLTQAVPFLLLIILGCVLFITIYSGANVHPDEDQHISATQYYMNHWLPPKIDVPETRYLYDHYGMTRLNNLGIEYFLAGKIASVLTWFGMPKLAAIRFFNPLLLLGVIVLTLFWRRQKSSLALLIPIFFLTPQVWYTFSYMNDDAFPYVLMLVALMLTLEKRYGFFLGLCIGLLILSKPNFLVFVVFIGFVIGIEIVRKKQPPLAKLCFAILMIIGIRACIDVSINGWGRYEKISAAAEKYSNYDLKLSTATNDPQKSHWLKAMRAKGIALKDLLIKYNWGMLTAASFISIYGYFNITPPEIFYLVEALLLILLALYLLDRLILARDRDVMINVALTALFGLMLVALALWRSWNFEFQPQGRHLFPFLGILAWLIYTEREKFNSKFLNSIFSLLYLGAIYSTVFVGIRRLI